MKLYRIKQFWWGITYKRTLEDKNFLKKYLNNEEIDLFNKLSIHEQGHCLRTAYDIREVCFQCNMDSNQLIKVALLHDIGKIQYKLNLVDKAIFVLLNKIIKNKLKNYTKYKKVSIYYNHPEIGCNILKNYNYSKRFLYLVKNHHNDDIIGDKELDILKKCDSKN